MTPLLVVIANFLRLRPGWHMSLEITGGADNRPARQLQPASSFLPSSFRQLTIVDDLNLVLAWPPSFVPDRLLGPESLEPCPAPKESDSWTALPCST